MRDKLAEAAARELDREVMNGVELTHYDRLNSAVRAVLLALREPSEGMVEAGEDCTDNYYSESGDFKRGWIAAIDSILSERTEGEG